MPLNFTAVYPAADIHQQPALFLKIKFLWSFVLSININNDDILRNTFDKYRRGLGVGSADVQMGKPWKIYRSGHICI